MNISNDPVQLQRQLYVLGYPQTLPADGAPLVSQLLSDLQVSLARVKELEARQSQLERNERVSRAGNEKYKGELHSLRTENNQLRTEVLGYTKQLDDAKREARASLYEAQKQADNLKVVNLQMKAEHSTVLRQLDDTKKKLQAKMPETDSVTRPIARLTMSKVLRPASKKPVPRKAPSATVELVDLSTRRIASLEEEVGVLERKLDSAASELSSTKLEVQARDLEIMRLNSEYAKFDMRADIEGDDPTKRLEDQIEYLHERIEVLEKENKQLKDDAKKNKDDVQRRLSGRIQGLSGTSPNPQTPVTSSHTLCQTDDVERLRTECENVKSLYAQTRDQLQELLRTGDSEAKQTEQSLRRQLDDAESRIQQLEAEVERTKSELVSSPQQIAKDRAKQISRLEKKLSETQKKYAQTSAELLQAQESLKKLQQSVGERQDQYDSTLSEYTMLIEQHKKLDKSLKQAVAEVDEWRAKADEKEHKVSEISRRLDEYKLGYKQASSELKTCKRTLETYTGDLAALRASQANHDRDVQQLQEELDQATKLRRATEMSKDDYKRQLAKALEECESHRGLAKHLQAERDGLRVQANAQFHLRQRLEQRLEMVDPNFVGDALRAGDDLSALSSSAGSLLERLNATRRPPKPSSSTSTRPSVQSFERYSDSSSQRGPPVSSDREIASTSSISMP
ncbi:hypothetical protein FBU59_000714 [Linderina macrospora]|uniref:Uncharacterized protein n=1 Tax=Linderina macrospora TaxID=4868 RepID=A0ACC1JGE5_9FUNG|nr:hypothetical protein FBU59_000714 [Linderina macrospora]